MIGAIAGDIIGSVYEYYQIKTLTAMISRSVDVEDVLIINIEAPNR